MWQWDMHCLFITVCKCVFCACTKVWECKRAGKILHRNAIGWPNYAQNSLANARDMGFHITGPACTNSPQPTIFRLSQWNLSNHTAGGWKDSWVETFFYSKLFMQGLGLANLRKYIFLHRKSGTLCHVYSGKNRVIITIFLIIYYHCFFIWAFNYAELCPKLIMYTLFLFSTEAQF